ncbi:hypothetical protein [Paenibacillus sp. SI8]|uniref:hypothetical protein n=1 Tax=unclassified Paenibacillus TaxID=185978 RepID=UPI003467BC25
MKKSMIGVVTAALLLTACGCGQKKVETAGESFGSAVSAATVAPSATPGPSAASSPKESAKEAQAVELQPPSAAPSPTPAAETASAIQPAAKLTEATASTAMPSEQPKAASSPIPAAVTEANVPSPTTAPASELKMTEALPSAKPKAESPSNEINWSQFFDDDKQDKPSEHFWGMSGKTVQIKGFMGEVLSFDKHWFLLIPKPGAECPFDNGDETYWNKIMIVFVPDNVKLRYTSGPLMITGKLDVGIKLDESGYKTMFRLYDASFEKIKE